MAKMIDEVKVDMGELLEQDGLCAIRDDRRAVHSTRWRRIVTDGRASWLMTVAVAVEEYFRLDTKVKPGEVHKQFGPAGFAGEATKDGDSDSDGDPRLITE